MRRYQLAKLVNTTYTAHAELEANEKYSIAFNKLFQYIDRGNERGRTYELLFSLNNISLDYV